MCHLMSLINSEVKRSYSTLNLFFFVLKFFFERKKSSVNMAMNSHSIFRLAENGVKINSLICGNTLSYEMSFNDFRFQLNEELSLLFDHGNHTLRKITREKRGKIMPKVFKKHNMQSYVVGILVKNLLVFIQFGKVHASDNTLFCSQP